MCLLRVLNALDLSNEEKSEHWIFLTKKGKKGVLSWDLNNKAFVFLITSFKLEAMLLGHADGLSELRSSNNQLLADHESEIDSDDTADSSEQLLYSASFEELAKNSIQYDTVIWLSISLLLVLAWGVGILMLLYLPFKRYILRKDISSRKLYVTPSEIVYKVNLQFHIFS